MNASFLLRFKAFMIDYILILFYLVVLFIFTVFLFPSLQGFFNGSLIVAQFTGFLLVTFPISLYFIISDSNIGKQSFGKRKTGIRVVGKNGEALSMMHVTIRTILKILPWELSHFLVYRFIYLFI
ncbi:RDD family protein [Radiobacillus kanasensis]|uniref:RDD family protein n=1 Tax=Radiobacillus kanasensis TaxID=2844358 RepID=UPI001E35B785|nr:RDD family protein [Radiobacillus kanasensis]UFT99630.1 RDD family protein [Radiobacillus kanasensis]